MTDLCAIFESTEDRFLIGDLGIAQDQNMDTRSEKRGSYDIETVVLVDDVEIVDHGEGVKSGEIPTLVRLRRLDFCPRVLRKIPDLVESTSRSQFALGGSFIPALSFGEDRELSEAGRVFPQAAELVRRVIERRPHGVDGITKDQTPPFVRKGFSDDGADNADPAVYVQFGENSVRVIWGRVGGIDLSLQAVELLLCPRELCSWAE